MKDPYDLPLALEIGDKILIESTEPTRQPMHRSGSTALPRPLLFRRAPRHAVKTLLLIRRLQLGLDHRDHLEHPITFFNSLGLRPDNTRIMLRESPNPTNF